MVRIPPARRSEPSVISMIPGGMRRVISFLRFPAGSRVPFVLPAYLGVLTKGDLMLRNASRTARELLRLMPMPRAMSMGSCSMVLNMLRFCAFCDAT